jgi:DNA-binding beta-propeller fold protein YncE
MLSVSLVSASSAANNFSGVLWSADATACTPSGSPIVRACARIDKVVIDSAGNASIPKGFDFDIGVAGNDILYPAVVGDTSGNHVWVADTITGSTFPTSELRLLSFTPTLLMHTVRYGSGAAAYTIDRDSDHNNLTRFGDYSGIFVDSSETSGATVWAATENAAVAAGKGWTTSLAEATFLPPKITSVKPNSGFAGQQVTILGNDFSATTAVRFGAIPALQTRFFGSNELTAVAPGQSPTTVNVFATTVLGTDIPLPGPPLPFPGVADRFTYKYLLWASGADPAGNVVAIDPITDTRERAFNTGGGMTQGIALSPDASTVFAVSPATAVLGWGSAATGTLSGSINVGVSPTEITITPDGQFAMITDPGAFGGTGGVIPVQLNTADGIPTPLAPVAVPDPRGIAAAPNGSVYVTSGSGGDVAILTFAPCGATTRWCTTGAVTVPVGTPGPIAAGPDRMWLGVAGPPAGPPGLVYSINFAASPPTLSTGIPIDGAPNAMAVSPNGAFVFAIASSVGHAYPVHHNPPNPDQLLSPLGLPNGPLGGGAVSFDNTLLFVAGTTSGDLNKAGVPGPYMSALASGPLNSAELATNVPPNTSCNGADWADPSTGLTFSESPAKAGTLVTATASLLYCPPPTSGPGSAIPTLKVSPPPSTCPSFTETQKRETLAAGVVSFSFQFPAKCTGAWKVTASLASFIGAGTPPPAFKPAAFTISA